jgi:hypothetical protein
MGSNLPTTSLPATRASTLTADDDNDGDDDDIDYDVDDDDGDVYSYRLLQ